MSTVICSQDGVLFPCLVFHQFQSTEKLVEGCSVGELPQNKLNQVKQIPASYTASMSSISPGMFETHMAGNSSQGVFMGCVQLPAAFPSCWS